MEGGAWPGRGVARRAFGPSKAVDSSASARSGVDIASPSRCRSRIAAYRRLIPTCECLVTRPCLPGRTVPFREHDMVARAVGDGRVAAIRAQLAVVAARLAECRLGPARIRPAGNAFRETPKAS